MLFLLSPAKSLDYDTPLGEVPHTEPQFIRQSTELIALLKTKSSADVAELMDLSEALSDLNVARYRSWSPKFTAKNSRQAMLAFNGDVYEGLDARTLKPKDLAWAQEHIAILSGLYGVLRPLDWMQPYRLEMGTALANAHGHNLYKFWGRTLADHVQAQVATHEQPVIVNLASQEYFKAVDRKALQARVIDCVFEERKGPGYKIISFMAKRARGLMARYAITQRVTTPAALEKFNLEGYTLAKAVSEPNRLVFRREAA
ncbi:MAG: hypothetical protein RJA69_1628 [Pseudomonadota bacterium]|jgi:cytoplasmic iron level regulating protein YaaA (DUF328/UPF0246 family)